MRSLALVCIAAALAAPAATAGPFAQAFLPATGGARAFALGGHTAAFVEDAAGVFQNPARLAFASGPSASAGYATLVEGISSSRVELAYARPLGPDIAAPLQRGGAHRLAAGVGIEFQTLELARGSGYSEGVGSIAAALAPINFVAAGLAVRGLRTFGDVDGLSASGLALDVGVSIAVLPTIEFAVVGRNVAGSVTYEDRASEQPLRTLTAAAALMRHRWLGAEAGVTTESEDGLVYHGGVEARPIPAVALRGGVRHRVRPEGRTTPSAGIGLHTGGFRIDYGIRLGDEEDLGVAHRVSLTWVR
jgi:hypothetical protein